MKAMTMFTAQVAGQQNNAHYPHAHTVTTAAFVGNISWSPTIVEKFYCAKFDFV
ncbi:hypothetical protein [Corynebacterium propinquum]|uniref:hypothetical protein n=1 Tax=Corynebacterium propinquum TaxID=43769 RepID=UPI0016428439|nr:hypothetical protein [Corynebacterium propinquum]